MALFSEDFDRWVYSVLGNGNQSLLNESDHSFGNRIFNMTVGHGTFGMKGYTEEQVRNHVTNLRDAFRAWNMSAYRQSQADQVDRDSATGNASSSNTGTSGSGTGFDWADINTGSQRGGSSTFGKWRTGFSNFKNKFSATAKSWASSARASWGSRASTTGQSSTSNQASAGGSGAGAGSGGGSGGSGAGSGGGLGGGPGGGGPNWSWHTWGSGGPGGGSGGRSWSWGSGGPGGGGHGPGWTHGPGPGRGGGGSGGGGWGKAGSVWGSFDEFAKWQIQNFQPAPRGGAGKIGGLAGTVIGAMVGGPLGSTVGQAVGTVLGNFVDSLKNAVTQAHAFAVELQKTNLKYANMSGMLAASFAQSDVQRFYRDMQVARGIAPSAISLNKAITKYEETTIPRTIFSQNMSNDWAQGKLGVAQKIEEGFYSPAAMMLEDMRKTISPKGNALKGIGESIGTVIADAMTLIVGGPMLKVLFDMRAMQEKAKAGALAGDPTPLGAWEMLASRPRRLHARRGGF